jgi:hypothetical protein
VPGEAVAVDAVQRRTAAFCSSKTTVPASRLLTNRGYPFFLIVVSTNGMNLGNTGGFRV